MIVNWGTEVLDDGRMVVVHVGVKPEIVQSEVKRVFAEIATKAPPKGFRAGRVAESVLRRLHGKRVLDTIRADLVAKSYGVAIPGAAARHRFDPKKASPPEATKIEFSEEDGLTYDVVVTGLEPTPAPGTVVDLAPTKTGD